MCEKSVLVHTICGRADKVDEEGFGSSVWYPACDIRGKNKKREDMRSGIKKVSIRECSKAIKFLNG